jgi:NAD(P)-dependent dehydrogenase (short-subunit alcohol dehydrogenase family)
MIFTFRLRDKDSIMKLQGKTALITGGNSGIGLATARLFVAEGANVVITGRNQQTLDAAVAQLGPRVVAVRGDVTDLEATERAVKAAIERFGGLDIVFANAGIGGATPVGQTTTEAFENIIRTNLTSVFFTVQTAVPHLKPGSSIILNGSVHAVLGAPAYSAYAAAKAGVRSMTRVLASELATRGIRVNVVVPGATRTPIWSTQAPTPQAFDALEARLSKGIALGQMGDPEDIARMVLFLASDEAKYIDGGEFVVDGGMTGSPYGAPVYRG